MSTSRNTAALLALCVALAACATPPPSVPSNASASYDWYNSHFTYTWSRALRSGCAAWVATDRWANVQLVLNSRCARRRDEAYLDGQGVSFFSSSGYLIFRGYWPWTEQEFARQIEFDDKGMISHIRPCPYTLSPEQLTALRTLAQEALNSATTEAERRMLTRVNERLAATNGAALGSGQEGCTDLLTDGAPVPRQNLWTTN